MNTILEDFTNQDKYDAYNYLNHHLNFYQNPIFSHEFGVAEQVLQRQDGDNMFSKTSTRNKDYYHYIPMDNRYIAERILNAYKKAKSLRINLKYFLDVGCGPAFSLQVAELLGLKPFGIEISELTGKQALEKYPDQIFIGDAFNFDFSQLENTLIYTYMPIRNGLIMGELAAKICREIQPGNLWTEMFPVYVIRAFRRVNVKYAYLKKKLHTIRERY